MTPLIDLARRTFNRLASRYSPQEPLSSGILRTVASLHGHRDILWSDELTPISSEAFVSHAQALGITSPYRPHHLLKVIASAQGLQRPLMGVFNAARAGQMKLLSPHQIARRCGLEMIFEVEGWSRRLGSRTQEGLWVRDVLKHQGVEYPVTADQIIAMLDTLSQRGNTPVEAWKEGEPWSSLHGKEAETQRIHLERLGFYGVLSFQPSATRHDTPLTNDDATHETSEIGEDGAVPAPTDMIPRKTAGPLQYVLLIDAGVHADPTDLAGLYPASRSALLQVVPMRRKEMDPPRLPAVSYPYHDVMRLRGEMAHQSHQALGLMAGTLLARYPESRDANWIVMTASHQGRALCTMLGEFGITSGACFQTSRKRGPVYDSGYLSRYTLDRLAKVGEGRIQSDDNSSATNHEEGSEKAHCGSDPGDNPPIIEPTEQPYADPVLAGIVSTLQPLGNLDLSPGTDAWLGSVDTSAPMALQIEQMANDLGREPPWSMADARKITRRLLRLHRARRLSPKGFPILDDVAICAWMAMHGHSIVDQAPTLSMPATSDGPSGRP